MPETRLTPTALEGVIFLPGHDRLSELLILVRALINAPMPVVSALPSDRATVRPGSNKGKNIVKTLPSLPKGSACASCKARKIRCGGQVPTCQSCARSARFENREAVPCRYGCPRKPSTRRVPKVNKTSPSSSPVDTPTPSSNGSTADGDSASGESELDRAVEITSGALLALSGGLALDSILKASAWTTEIPCLTPAWPVEPAVYHGPIDWAALPSVDDWQGEDGTDYAATEKLSQMWSETGLHMGGLDAAQATSLSDLEEEMAGDEKDFAYGDLSWMTSDWVPATWN